MLHAAAYELAQAIIGSRLDEMPSNDVVNERLEVEPVDILISFASVDRAWADWISAEMAGAGREVQLQAIDQEQHPQAVAESAERILVLQSAGFALAPMAPNFLQFVMGGGSSKSILARFDRTIAVPQGTDVATLDLTGSEGAARSELRRVLGISTGAVVGAPWTTRFPKREPRIVNLGPRMENFFGRVGLLNAIRTRFTASDSPAPLVLAGKAGVGKTTLALEYAYRFASDYDIVWWISAENRTLAEGGLFDLAERLDIPAGVDPAVRRLLGSLRRGDSGERWLIVFDAADEPADLNDLVPHGNGHLLITSREPEWGSVQSGRPAEVLNVDAFERVESMAYLLRRVPSMGEADAQKLAEELDDLPLAVSQAGDFLSSHGRSVQEFLSKMNHDVSAASLVALDQLRKEMPVAAKAFEVLTFLAAEPIPEKVYLSRAFIQALIAIDAGLKNAARRRSMMSKIEHVGLAHVDRPSMDLRVHRLVQAVIRDQQTDAEKAENLQLAFMALADANPGDPERKANWPAYQALWPHVASAGLFDSDSPEVRGLIVDLIRYRYKIGDFRGSEELSRQVLARWSAGSAAEDLYSLQVGYHRGRALRRLGDIESAHEVDRVISVKMRDTLGPDELDTLMVESGLATDLRALGKYAEALTLDQDILERAKTSVGEDDERALMFASNLATSYRMMGDPARAEEIDRHTYELRRRVLGEEHPYTAFSAGSLGRDLRDLARFGESQDWLELSLESYRQHLGPDHPDTLRAAKNLAVTLRRLALFDRAHQLSIDTHHKATAKLGSNHPDTLVCLMAVATTYSGLGIHDRARRAARDAVRDLGKVLGPGHVYTLLARNNLHAIELKADPPIANVQEMEEVKRELGRQLREGHWIMSIVALNLANHHAEAGAIADALFLDEETCEQMDARFGPLHHDSIAAAINLAISQKDNGQFDRADELMREAANRGGIPLPPDHPRVVAARTWNRWTFTYVDPPPLM